jgi:hypothetical protein
LLGQDYMDVVNEGGFACHAKLNPAPTMTVCLPHYPYKYATYSWYAVYTVGVALLQ